MIVFNQVIKKYFLIDGGKYCQYIGKMFEEDGKTFYKVFTTTDPQFRDISFFSKNADRFTTIESFDEIIQLFENSFREYGILHQMQYSSQGYILYNMKYYIIGRQKDGNIKCIQTGQTFHPETYETIEDEAEEEE